MTADDRKPLAGEYDISKPLADADFERLGDFLSRVKKGKIPNLDALDGYATALACGNELVLRMDVLQAIVEGETESGNLLFEDDKEILELWTLLNRYVVYLKGVLADEKQTFKPRIRSRRRPGSSWARGYIAGTCARPWIWQDVITTKICAGLVGILVAFDTDGESDPELRVLDRKVVDRDREEMLLSLAAEVQKIFDFFAASGEKFPMSTLAPKQFHVKRHSNVDDADMEFDDSDMELDDLDMELDDSPADIGIPVYDLDEPTLKPQPPKRRKSNRRKGASVQRKW